MFVFLLMEPKEGRGPNRMDALLKSCQALFDFTQSPLWLDIGFKSSNVTKEIA